MRHYVEICDILLRQASPCAGSRQKKCPIAAKIIEIPPKRYIIPLKTHKEFFIFIGGSFPTEVLPAVRQKTKGGL